MVCDVLEKYIGSWVYIESNEDKHEHGYCYNHYVGKVVDTDQNFIELKPFRRISSRFIDESSFFTKGPESIREYELGKTTDYFLIKELEGEIINRKIIEKLRKIKIRGEKS